MHVTRNISFMDICLISGLLNLVHLMLFYLDVNVVIFSWIGILTCFCYHMWLDINFKLPFLEPEIWDMTAKNFKFFLNEVHASNSNSYYIFINKIKKIDWAWRLADLKDMLQFWHIMNLADCWFVILRGFSFRWNG